VTTGSSVFSTLLFHQLIPPREVLRSNLAPDRQYQRTTTTKFLMIYVSSSLSMDHAYIVLFTF